MKKLFLLATLAACQVPDKRPPGDDDSGGEPNPGEIDTQITLAPAEFSNLAVATFEFQSNVTTAHFECRVDDKPAAACTSPFVMPLADGSHTFMVRAIDGNGVSDDTPAEHVWSIDTVAPNTTLTEAPPAADNSTTVHFLFTSSEANVSFDCSLDNAAFVACTSGADVGPIGDGPHSFAVRARDRAGNVDASPAIHAWTVDTSTPDTTILSGPIGPTADASASFTFLSPDAGPGATFQCSLDGRGFDACSSPQAYQNLAMGVHTFAVRVRDAGGNLDPTPATRTWTVDLTPPETTIDSGPTGMVGSASASITFTSNEENSTFSCSLDGAGFAPCTSPFNVTGLAQGAHSFAVAAIDSAGHIDPTPATASWFVDTTAPDIMIFAGPADGDVTGPRVSFMFTVSEGTTECAIDGGAFAACTGPVSYNLPPGTHSFTLRALDAAGNSTTVVRTFTVVCNAPDATSSAGLLHFEDGAQILVNAAGGASATLGPTDQVETADPVLTTGRFGAGVQFTAGEGDLVAWPLGVALATSDFTIELWARPDVLSGTRDIVLSGDSRIAIRVTPDSATTVRISATVVGNNNVANTVTSAPVAAGTWHWIMVSLQEPVLRLWIDGARVENGDVRLNLVPSLGSLQFGGNYGGMVDEVWLSQVAITTDDSALTRYCPL